MRIEVGITKKWENKSNNLAFIMYSLHGHKNNIWAACIDYLFQYK